MKVYQKKMLNCEILTQEGLYNIEKCAIYFQLLYNVPDRNGEEALPIEKLCRQNIKS